MSNEIIKISKEEILKDIERVGLLMTIKRKNKHDELFDYLYDKLKIPKSQSLDIISDYFLKKSSKFKRLGDYVEYLGNQIEKSPYSDDIMVDKQLYNKFIMEKLKLES